MAHKKEAEYLLEFNHEIPKPRESIRTKFISDVISINNSRPIAEIRENLSSLMARTQTGFDRIKDSLDSSSSEWAVVIIKSFKELRTFSEIENKDHNGPTTSLIFVLSSAILEISSLAWIDELRVNSIDLVANLMTNFDYFRHANFEICSMFLSQVACCLYGLKYFETDVV